MTHIRVGQDGWDRTSWAESLDEVQVGIGVQWVEIVDDEGYVTRIPASSISRVSWEANGAEFSSVDVRLIGALKIVYLDKQGVPLE